MVRLSSMKVSVSIWQSPYFVRPRGNDGVRRTCFLPPVWEDPSLPTATCKPVRWNATSRQPCRIGFSASPPLPSHRTEAALPYTLTLLLYHTKSSDKILTPLIRA